LLGCLESEAAVGEYGPSVCEELVGELVEFGEHWSRQWGRIGLRFLLKVGLVESAFEVLKLLEWFIIGPI
jgi:hypothetical protein